MSALLRAIERWDDRRATRRMLRQMGHLFRGWWK